jgi:peptidylprolyl isomerase
MTYLNTVVLSIGMIFAAASCGGEKSATNKMTIEENTTSKVVEIPKESQKEKVKMGDGIFAKITTNRGEVTLQLEFEKAPVTVANFVGLAEGKIENDHKALGEPYYDGIVFHRVISVANGQGQDFMIQGGDPLGKGIGGPGYKFQDEFDASLKHDRKGVFSMANSGPHTNGSQFFITIVPTPHLDNRHTVFGYVIEGQDIVDATLQGDVMEKVEIIRKGKAAKNFDAAAIFKESAILK